MAKNSKFDLDFRHGVEGEGMLFDLIKNGKVEVKRDRESHRTGNVAVEISCRGEPSGIAVTEAEWWAFVLDNEIGTPHAIVIVPLWHLKYLAKRCAREGKLVMGGDDKASKMILIPKADLLKHI
jgi:hypothetical protein